MAYQFTRLRMVGPAIIGVTLLVLTFAALPFYAIENIDGEARQRQEALVKRNVLVWISDTEFSLTGWTIWDEAIAKLDSHFDPEWAERNIGSSLIGTSRTRAVIILDRDNSVIYSKTDAAVKNLQFFARGTDAFKNDAAALIAEVRSYETRPKPAGIPKPLAASHVIVMGSQAVLLTASAFQADFGTAKPLSQHAPILITAMPISGTLPGFFGDRFLLDDPRIGPLAEVTADRARAQIAVGATGEKEVLSWRPPTPARDLLQQSLPLFAIVFAILFGGGFALIKISQRAALDLAREEQRMRHAAAHDFLTGLANRSVLKSEFDRLTKASTLAVICIDLDGFKGVNDQHGHAIGDQLLKIVASRLRAGTRTDDVIFRLGGDEFVIMMPQTNAIEAEAFCWHLSSSISATMYLSTCEVTIGASFGITEADATTSCDGALKTADAALYRAKASGRGRVVVAEPMLSDLTEATLPFDAKIRYRAEPHL